MKKTTFCLITALAAVSALALSACGTNGGAKETPSPSGDADQPADKPVTLTLSGWSLETTPEFQVLADAFHAANPNVTVEIKEYDANDYGTLMLADMSAGAAPDIITIKEAKALGQWVDGGQLLDVSDVVSALPDNVSGAGSYAIDGVNYAAPYRQDSWVLYYNIDLFNKAGINPPDGSWTWDDYASAAKELTAKAGGAKGAYEHSWQSTLQGFAQAQTPGADLAGGSDYSYLKPYYERVLDLQNAGAQESYGNIQTNKLTYQGQFGKQEAAMMAMGSWYVATLITQQASGEADSFAWGIAPIPQYDASTTGTGKVPVTFGDPTGMAINAANAAVDADKLAAAKAFLAFAASEDAGKALAEIGIVSSVSSDAVTAAYFGQTGIPTDELSKFAMSTHDTRPENPQSPNIAAIQTALGEAHTAIMSGSTGIDAAIAQATETIKAEIG